MYTNKELAQTDLFKLEIGSVQELRYGNLTVKIKGKKYYMYQDGRELPIYITGSKNKMIEAIAKEMTYLQRNNNKK